MTAAFPTNSFASGKLERIASILIDGGLSSGHVTSALRAVMDEFSQFSEDDKSRIVTRAVDPSQSLVVDEVADWLGGTLPSVDVSSKASETNETEVSPAFGLTFMRQLKRRSLSESFFKSLVLTFPNDPEILAMAGIDSSVRKSIRRSLLTRALTLSRGADIVPNFGESALTEYVTLSNELSLKEEALAAIRTALHVEWRVDNAVLLTKQMIICGHSFDQVEEEFAVGLRDAKHDHERAKLLSAFGKFLHQRGEYSRAVEEYQRAVDYTPADIWLHLALFQAILDSGANISSEQWAGMNDLLTEDPSSEYSSLPYALPYVLKFATQSGYDSPVLDSTVAHALEAKSSDHVVAEWAIYLSAVRGDHTSARRYFQSLRPTTTTDSEVLFQYAHWNWRFFRAADTARAAYVRCLQLNPEGASALANLSQIHFAMGDAGSGIQAATHALQLNPNRAVTVEALFYLWAHSPDHTDDALRKLKPLVSGKARSTGWSFESDLELILKKHPERIEFATDLALALTGDTNVDLDRHPAWRSL